MKLALLSLFTTGATLIAVVPPARAQERGYCAPNGAPKSAPDRAPCDCPQCRRSCPEGAPVERHYYYHQPYCPDDGCRGEFGIRTPSLRIPSLRFGLSFDGDCDRGHCHYVPYNHRPCCHPTWCCPPAPPRAPLVSSVSAVTVPQQAIAINPVAFGAAVPAAIAPTVYAPQMVLPARPVAPAQVAPAQAAPAQVVPAQLRIQAAPEAPGCQGTPDAAMIRLLTEVLRAESQQTNQNASQNASQSPSQIPQAPAEQSNEQKLEELRKQVQKLKALLNQL